MSSAESSVKIICTYFWLFFSNVCERGFFPPLIQCMLQVFVYRHFIIDKCFMLIGISSMYTTTKTPTIKFSNKWFYSIAYYFVPKLRFYVFDFILFQPDYYMQYQLNNWWIDFFSVTQFKQLKLEKEAQKNWDLFYKRNATKFFKDRHWTKREFEELCQTEVIIKY